MNAFVFVAVLHIVCIYSVPVLGAEEYVEILSDAELKAKHEAMGHPDLYGGDILGFGPDNHAYGNIWPGGLVPYEIDRSLYWYRDRIYRAMQELQDKTCIRFRRRTSSDDAYILLKDGNGCNSYVGKMGWRAQPVNLQINGCLSHSTILHELGHAIGFLHTHQRQDRDDFIRIYWENIQSQYRSQFDTESGRVLVPYDTTSVMHYDSYAASSNGRPVMLTRSGGEIRNPSGLSTNDVRAIKILYSC